MRKQTMFLAIPAFLLVVAGAQADIYDFSYSGAGGVFGTGTFTTGTAYADGYLPILAITGTTEGGAITGLVPGNADPPNVLSCCSYNYDNAFLPNSPNPFSSSGGVLFTVLNGSVSPINLFGDGNGNTYEFSYGEDSFTGNPPSYGGTPITFTAIDVSATPEPSFYGTVALCMSGLIFARWRRRRTS
jgi:hypothetical protein